jgi:hypothetical protein
LGPQAAPTVNCWVLQAAPTVLCWVPQVRILTGG